MSNLKEFITSWSELRCIASWFECTLSYFPFNLRCNILCKSMRPATTTRPPDQLTNRPSTFCAGAHEKRATPCSTVEYKPSVHSTNQRMKMMDDITFSTGYCMCVQLAVVPGARTTLNLNIYLCKTKYIFVFMSAILRSYQVQSSLEMSTTSPKLSHDTTSTSKMKETRFRSTLQWLVRMFFFLFHFSCENDDKAAHFGEITLQCVWFFAGTKLKKRKWDGEAESVCVRSCDFERISPFFHSASNESWWFSLNHLHHLWIPIDHFTISIDIITQGAIFIATNEINLVPGFVKYLIEYRIIGSPIGSLMNSHTVNNLCKCFCRDSNKIKNKFDSAYDSRE